MKPVSWATAVGGVFLLGAGLFGACGDDETVPVPPGPALDERLGADQVRAGQITKASELIGGDTAKGRIGDYKLYNGRIAVIIGAAGESRGYHPYGGTILDADRVRPAGEGGKSNFGEVINALDLSVLRADRVEVLSDGKDGKEARVRVSGEPDKFPIFDAILSSLLGSKSYDMDWSIDYVLEPGADVLRIENTVFNRSAMNIDFGLPIVAFFFGDGARPFLESYGFAPPSTGGTGEYYGAAAEEVSYIYGRVDERVTLIITDSGTVVTGIGGGFTLRARERKAFSYALVVGDGDFSTTQSTWRRFAGRPAGGTVSGVVRSAAGTPLPGARVHALLAEPASAELDYVTRAKTDAEGRYALSLPAGRYRLSVVVAGQRPVPGEAFQVAEGGGVTKELSAAPIGTLEYHYRDTEGRDLPVKLSIQDAAGPVDDLPKRYGEETPGSGLVWTVFAEAGRGNLELPVGEYRIHASRGNEYEVDSQEVSLGAGAKVNVTGTLTRSVGTPGWMSTDTHVHAQLSPDSPDLYPYKVRTMVVEGLEVPVSTEHEAIGDFNPAIRALELTDWIHGIVGSEVTTFTYGHFNAFPLVPDPSKTNNGRIDWYGRKPADTFANIRANPGDPFLQVNHPRGNALGGYFSAMGYEATPFTFDNADYSADFDGIEVMNGCGNGSIYRDTIQDWFAYLNHGVKKVGTASTDNHKAQGGDMGLPKTFVRLSTDVPKEVSVDELRSAFKRGQLTLSCGPFVEMKIGDQEIGGTVMLQGDELQIQARVAAPSWVDVDVLEVLVNGQVVKAVPLSGAIGGDRFMGTVTASVPAGRDSWVALVARGDRPHGIWVRGRPSFALTNPIFVEGNGERGTWQP